MAPGQRQDLTRVALQQAQKSAEALFETKSIADIKKVRERALITRASGAQAPRAPS